MPRMPSERIEAAVSNNVTPIRGATMSGANPVAEATSELGRTVNDMTSRIREAHIQAEVVDAQFTLEGELDGAYRELQSDMEGDPAEFESRLRERSKEIIAKTGKNMSSPMHKRMWEQATQERVESWALQTRDLTRTRQIDGAKAKTVDARTKYEKMAQDPSIARKQLEQGFIDYSALIDSQLEAGLYSKEEAAREKASAQINMEAGVSVRHVSEVDNRMDAGDYASAEEYFKVNYGEIDPKQREQIETAIESKGREQKAMERGDAIYSEAEGDYAKMLEQVRTIKNVDDRIAAENRINQLKAQDDAAETATQDVVKEEMLDLVVDGASWAQMPSALMRKADAHTRDYIQTEIRTRQQWAQSMATMTAQERADIKERSAISKDFLSGIAAIKQEAYMMGPENWAIEAPYMAEAYEDLVPEHKSEVLMDIRKRQAKGEAVDTTSAILSDLVGQIPMFAPDGSKGKNYKTGSAGQAGKRTFTNEEKAVRASLYNQAREHAARTGGSEISPEQSRVMIARAFRSYDADKFPYKEPGAWVNPIVKEIAKGPDYDTARVYLREKMGREPTPVEIASALQALGDAE